LPVAYAYSQCCVVRYPVLMISGYRWAHTPLTISAGIVYSNGWMVSLRSESSCDIFTYAHSFPPLVV